MFCWNGTRSSCRGSPGDFSVRSSSVLIRSQPEMMQFQSESAETFKKPGKLELGGVGSACGVACSGSRLAPESRDNGGCALDLFPVLLTPGI